MMGEYADEYYRSETKEKFGFDPGSMYPKDKPKIKPKTKPRASKKPCKLCGKFVAGMSDHLRDAHKENS
jgi:hypothetical protein